ncbi:hypothetical protein Misp01_60310 [Microtetraspora sp. NBRC 13810]|nr:hypothetical protein [Microtetraspora sp. NBRC 13810]GLW10903.1 hypothetical protein Misp01_60310 [Microtetraspora sp. NBRC 13810]
MTTADHGSRRTGLMVLAWLWVGLPLAYGVYELILKLTQLFVG